MNLNTKFLTFSPEFPPENLGSVSEEQGEQF